MPTPLPLFEAPRRDPRRAINTQATGAARRPPIADPVSADGGVAAEDLCRGITRLLGELGYRTLTEMRLSSGRRVDVIGLDGRGRFAVVEVKSSRADFAADQKWPDYLPFCDLFYFGVARAFPIEILPPEPGIIIADRYDATIARPAETAPMTAARRSRQTLQFAHTAAARLNRLRDGVSPIIESAG